MRAILAATITILAVVLASANSALAAPVIHVKWENPARIVKLEIINHEVWTDDPSGPYVAEGYSGGTLAVSRRFESEVYFPAYQVVIFKRSDGGNLWALQGRVLRQCYGTCGPCVWSMLRAHIDVNSPEDSWISVQLYQETGRAEARAVYAVIPYSSSPKPLLGSYIQVIVEADNKQISIINMWASPDGKADIENPVLFCGAGEYRVLVVRKLPDAAKLAETIVRIDGATTTTTATTTATGTETTTATTDTGSTSPSAGASIAALLGVAGIAIVAVFLLLRR